MTLEVALFAAFLGMLVSILVSRWAERLWLASTLFSTSLIILASGMVLLTGQHLDWSSSFRVGGEQVHLLVDSLSAYFMMLIGVVGGAATLYSFEYWGSRKHPTSARDSRFWWSLILLCMGLVVMTANGLHFLIAWEGFAISAYFLITLDRQHEEVRAAGWLYLVASHAGTLCLFAFFSALAAKTGSWELHDFKSQAELAPLVWLALFGFGVKAGMFPLHVWLPAAHANAPSHVSALMSGVAIKIGIYGIVRFTGWLPPSEPAAWFIAAVGSISAVFGVVFALGQHDLKRLLAYHSVENIGIILMGIGFGLVAVVNDHAEWGRLALIGGLLHVWNHGLFKSLLFFGAGSVLHATGTREMSRLGGLWRRMPWTAALFGLGAAAIVGLPPLNGFVSEFLVYLGLMTVMNGHGLDALPAMASIVMLALTGALALACFIKVCGVVFLGAPRSSVAERAHESGIPMRSAMIVVASGCVAIGMLPARVWPLVSRAAEVWNPGWPIVSSPAALDALGILHPTIGLALVGAVLLLAGFVGLRSARRSLTWDCGYAQPTARMQYTAGSFAQIVTSWFAWILRPEVRSVPPVGAFPVTSSHSEHTPETVLEVVFEPIAARIVRVASVARGLQHGRLQYYLLYLIVAVIVLGAMTWWTARA